MYLTSGQCVLNPGKPPKEAYISRLSISLLYTASNLFLQVDITKRQT